MTQTVIHVMAAVTTTMMNVFMACGAAKRPKLSHAGAGGVNREAELQMLPGVGCSVLLGSNARSISNNLYLRYTSAGAEPQNQPFGINAYKSSLWSQPVNKIPITEIVSRRRLPQHRKHLRACLSFDRPPCNQPIRHLQPNTLATSRFVSAGSTIKRLAAKPHDRGRGADE